MILSTTKRRFQSTVAALAVFAGLATVSGSASAETVLSYSPWLPPGYVLNDAVLYPWMEEVEEVTEGRVRVEPRAAGVGSPREQFDVVRDGLADISIIPLGYAAGRFPLVEIGELPLLHENDAILAPTFYRIYQEHLAQFEPFEGTHLLSLYTSTPAHLSTTTGIIKEIDDLEGLKLRVPNSTASEVAKAVGAIPIQKSITEMHGLVSTGVIDGTFFAPHSVVDFSLEKYLKYMTLVPGGVGQSVQVLLVNEDKWNAIGEADQQAIMAISGERIARAAGKAFAESEEEATAKLREAGVTIEQMSPEVTKAFVERLETVDQGWYASAKADGLSDPQAVLADFRAELKAAAQAK